MNGQLRPRLPCVVVLAPRRGVARARCQPPTTGEANGGEIGEVSRAETQWNERGRPPLRVHLRAHLLIPVGEKQSASLLFCLLLELTEATLKRTAFQACLSCHSTTFVLNCERYYILPYMSRTSTTCSGDPVFVLYSVLWRERSNALSLL